VKFYKKKLYWAEFPRHSHIIKTAGYYVVLQSSLSTHLFLLTSLALCLPAVYIIVM